MAFARRAFRAQSYVLDECFSPPALVVYGTGFAMSLAASPKIRRAVMARGPMKGSSITVD
jgi:hypothetical protein